MNTKKDSKIKPDQVPTRPTPSKPVSADNADRENSYKHLGDVIKNKEIYGGSKEELEDNLYDGDQE